jgi:hypothetical protein
MSFAAKLHWSSPEKRGQNRYKLAIGLTLHEADGTAIDVEVENLSVTGIGLRCRQDLPVGSRAWLGIPGLGNHEIEIVRRDGNFYGCKLGMPLKAATFGERPANAAVIFGRFTPRPTAFLQDAARFDVAIERWPQHARFWMMIATPLALWLAVFGIRFFAG